MIRAMLAAATCCIAVAGCTASVTGTGSPGTGPAPSRSVPSTGATVTVTASPSAVVPSAPTTQASPVTFSQLYARQRSGVVRIETVGCSDAGLGTGFLLSSELVATVAHVVDRSVVVSLIAGNQRTTGTVIGIDRTHDLALVRPARPLTGRAFRFRPTLPAVGDPVAAIGFPYGDPLTLTQGHISGLQRRIPLDGQIRTGLIETDTAINPGNSGGPLIAADGSVVGLVDAGRTDANGIGYAVSGVLARARTTSWAQGAGRVPPAVCSDPLGPAHGGANTPTPGRIDGQSAAGIAAAFDTYFNGIDTGNYAAAYAVLSPRVRSQTSLSDFAAGDATSYDSDISVLGVQRVDADTVRIALTFTSLQRADKAPGNSGDTCDIWSLEYTMIRAPDNSWFIDGTTPYRGQGYRKC